MNYYIVHFHSHEFTNNFKRVQTKYHKKKSQVKDLHSVNVKVDRSFVYFPKAIKLFHIYDCPQSDRQKLYLTFSKRS